MDDLFDLMVFNQPKYTGDHKQIDRLSPEKYQGEPFTVNHFNALHENAFRFLEKEVAWEGEKLAFTHHLPSNECNIEQFKGSVLNPAFCVEKPWFVAASDVSAWIYGHSHRNVAGFEVKGTRMLTNQLG